ncbi:hypothetical protein MSAN_01959600 [Mycena sanguinolenta]|uniref:Uncharacterized protein n=1 Tax=Mycena sanguinolenta TaxID=230812 RepID=A0A8H6XNP5_9AGAR|nr:hypothetical protein MSAN_01959600 [Mycena sanguinolenta]
MLTYALDTHLFEDYWTTTLSRVFGAFTSGVLFGITLWQVCTAAYLIHHRAKGGNHWLAVAICATALLATAQLAIEIELVVLDFRTVRLAVVGEELALSETIRQAATAYLVFNLALVINNMVTDSIFIYRCYVVWGRNIFIVVVPILSLLASSIIGFLSSYEIYDPHVYIDIRIVFGFMLLTNVLLVALTAGRIWWMRRDVAGALEFSIVRTYDNVIAIILESGGIYCISLIMYLVAVSILTTDSLSPVIPIFRAAMTQVMNIAPTLIIVRAGLGLSIESNKTDSDQSRTTSQPFNIRPPGQMDYSTRSILSVSMIQSVGRERAEP